MTIRCMPPRIFYMVLYLYIKEVNVILPIAFCIMLLIFLLAGCDSIIEYIVCSLFSMFGSIFLSLVVIECANPETYSAETIATYDIIALSDNFSSEDGLCYSFLYQTDKGITSKSIKADKTYIQETSDAPYTVRFKNPVLNVLFGSWSTEYNIYIPEGSFIQDGYGISLE